METKEQQYQELVKQMTPAHSVWKNIFHAFWMGGAICTVGQFFTNMYMNMGMEQEMAVKWNLITLIALTVVLTGLGWFAKMAKLGGAGALVPITGFANSVAASAIEYKKEGQVFGIGCKIFTIAGPVILYGIIVSWILGLAAFVLMKLNIISLQI